MDYHYAVMLERAGVNTDTNVQSAQCGVDLPNTTHGNR